MTSALAITQPISNNYDLLKIYPRGSIFRLEDTILDEYIEVDYDYMLTSQEDYHNLIGVQLPSRYEELMKIQFKNIMSKEDYYRFDELAKDYPPDYFFIAIESDKADYEIIIDSLTNLSFLFDVDEISLY